MRSVVRSGCMTLALAASLIAGLAVTQAASGNELIASFRSLNSACRGEVGAQMSWHRCGPDSLR